MARKPDPRFIETMRELEESLWRTETRFDREYVEKIFSPDFVEFGRSGRVYTRQDTLAAPAKPINVRLPLREFQARMISEDVVLVTYISETIDSAPQAGNRSSLWKRTDGRWQIVFHQGTPVKPQRD